MTEIVDGIDMSLIGARQHDEESQNGKGDQLVLIKNILQTRLLTSSGHKERFAKQVQGDQVAQGICRFRAKISGAFKASNMILSYPKKETCSLLGDFFPADSLQLQLNDPPPSRDYVNGKRERKQTNLQALAAHMLKVCFAAVLFFSFCFV